MTSTPFGPPFDDTDADTILRSSDWMYFYVHSDIAEIITCLQVHVFTTPQPNAGVSEKRVIDFTENSRTIAILLSCIYPVMTQVMSEGISVDDLRGAPDQPESTIRSGHLNVYNLRL